MTSEEFKAWFEGFTENIEDKPTLKQWKRIQERIKEIDGRPVTPHWWITYYPSYYPTWYPTPITTTTGTITTGTSFLLNETADNSVRFNYTDALMSVGRAEALNDR